LKLANALVETPQEQTSLLDRTRTYPYSCEAIAMVSADPQQVFEFMDDHLQLSGHMSKRSWMMGGGRMTVKLDQLGGKAVGSHIRMGGAVWGIQLRLDEVITEHTPPTRKVWRTVGIPRLLVIGPYEMGVDICAAAGGSRLRVFVNYALPGERAGGWLRRWLADAYARWCTQQMAADTARHWGAPPRT
jgi:hypothetical protein